MRRLQRESLGHQQTDDGLLLSLSLGPKPKPTRQELTGRARFRGQTSPSKVNPQTNPARSDGQGSQLQNRPLDTGAASTSILSGQQLPQGIIFDAKRAALEAALSHQPKRAATAPTWLSTQAPSKAARMKESVADVREEMTDPFLQPALRSSETVEHPELAAAEAELARFENKYVKNSEHPVLVNGEGVKSAQLYILQQRVNLLRTYPHRPQRLNRVPNPGRFHPAIYKQAQDNNNNLKGYYKVRGETTPTEVGITTKRMKRASRSSAGERSAQ